MVVAQYSERQLPYDLAAEASVLGGLLIDNEALHRVMQIVQSDDFYLARNRFCFAACVAISQRGDAIDQVTVARELQRQDAPRNQPNRQDDQEQPSQLELVGGLAYLSQLITGTPTSVNVEYYARIVADTAAKRRIIDAGNRITQLGYEDTEDAASYHRQAVDTLFNVRLTDNNRGFVPLGPLLDPYLQGDTPDEESTYLQRLQSGYNNLDNLLGGMQRSDLLIVGARPGLGKSSLALNICANVAKDSYVCGIFSLEMSREQVAMRMLVAESGVDSHRLRLGLVSENEQNEISDAVGVLSGLPIFIDDTPFQTVMEMRSKAQRLQMEHGLDFLVVDYLQLIQGQGSRRGFGENRVQEISEISRSLKGMARDLKIPVFTCSQLSRVVENRPGHRPQLSDLRDSGSIEQDADVVMFIYREDKHYTEEEWEQHAPGRQYPRNIAELIVAKHRHGQTGSVDLYFHETLMRFGELSRYAESVA